MTTTEQATRADIPVEGMTCAACATRIERGLSRLPGVESAAVNFASGRAAVQYDPDATGLPAFKEKIEALGYHVAAVDDTKATLDAETHAIRNRLVLAAVLAVPVMLISMIEALQFRNWQWVAFALSTPVVAWSALPFHRATLMNLRHGAATMDTLVTVGTLAAYGWSVVALVFLGAADEMAGMSGMSEPNAPHVYFETAAVIVTLILLGR